MGFCCYYHKKTGELVFFPDELRNPHFEPEFWEEDMQKVENDLENYVQIDAMHSSDSFQVMSGFTDQLPDSATKARLQAALNRPKPFKAFKHVIDNSGKYREQWFAYKDARMQEWVVEEFDRAMRDIQNEEDDID